MNYNKKKILLISKMNQKKITRYLNLKSAKQFYHYSLLLYQLRVEIYIFLTLCHVAVPRHDTGVLMNILYRNIGKLPHAMN
jgi:hypothetical protein